MRGHIAKKGTKYYIVVRIPDEITGKPKLKWLSGDDKKGWDRKKDAEKAMPDVLNKLHDGTFKESTDETFGELMVTWLNDKHGSVREGTWKSYAWLVNSHLVPHLGRIVARNLQAKQIHGLYHKKLAPILAAASIKKLHVLIVDALNRSVTWGDLPRNVAAGIDLPKGKGKKKFEVWNEEQLDLFLEYAKHDQYFMAFELATSTGMRQSEILGLPRAEVDLNTKHIYVRQAYVKAETGHELDDPKSDSSERSISLFNDTIKYLKDHFAKQTEYRMRHRKLYKDHGLVIQTTTGTPVNPRNLSRNYYKILETIINDQEQKKRNNEPYVEFKKIRFHDLRHTHATILLKNGVHPKIVQERLGHSSVQVTLDIYSHVIPNLQEAVLQGIGDSITGGKNSSKFTI